MQEGRLEFSLESPRLTESVLIGGRDDMGDFVGGSGGDGGGGNGLSSPP